MLRLRHRSCQTPVDLFCKLQEHEYATTVHLVPVRGCGFTGNERLALTRLQMRRFVSPISAR